MTDKTPTQRTVEFSVTTSNIGNLVHLFMWGNESCLNEKGKSLFAKLRDDMATLAKTDRNASKKLGENFVFDWLRKDNFSGWKELVNDKEQLLGMIIFKVTSNSC